MLSGPESVAVEGETSVEVEMHLRKPSFPTRHQRPNSGRVVVAPQEATWTVAPIVAKCNGIDVSPTPEGEVVTYNGQAVSLGMRHILRCARVNAEKMLAKAARTYGEIPR